jgi:hypothetical protein
MNAAARPMLEDKIPELVDFVDGLAEEIEAGRLDNWEPFSARAQEFYTPARMAEIEACIPGWDRMASFEDGATLVHVTGAMAALKLLPEYRQAAPKTQTLSEWIVLMHDLGKEIYAGKRDHTHGFRSAVIAGRILPGLGFAVNAEYQDGFQAWEALTNAAFRPGTDGGDPIQDNRKLPQILAGIEALYGHNSDAALVVKAILLHFSINTCSDWPQVAPLSEEEVSLYIDQEFVPYLEIMMLVDSDAWALFDPADKAKMRAETLQVFQEVRRLASSG